MMRDDADDADDDGADDNVGDNDGVCVSLALAQAIGLAHNTTRPRGHRQRPAGPPPEAGTPGHAFTMGSTGVPTCLSHRLRRLGFAVPLPRHKDRLSRPVVKKLQQRDVVTTPDIPLPALARGRAALTLENCVLAADKDYT